MRLEVPNARNDLRLGMYAEVLFGDEREPPTVLIPRGALQQVGDRAVVYLVDPKQPGRFVEREVRLGTATDTHVAVLAGLRPGEQVVTAGSFSVRAERERLGLRAAPATTPGAAVPTPDAQPRAPAVQDVRVTVTEASFEPQHLVLRAGVPARVTFTRTSDKTCATAVVVPSLQVRRELPLNEPVTIAFTPGTAGEIAFACGMNMLRGTIVVR